MHTRFKISFVLVVIIFSWVRVFAQHNHDHHENTHNDHAHEMSDGNSEHQESHGTCGSHDGHAAFDPASTAIHHISDANVYSLLDWIRIPLPTMLYAEDRGWDVFMSNVFEIGHHEDGHQSYNGYVMHEGSVYRVADKTFPQEGSVHLGGFTTESQLIDGKKRDVTYVCYEGNKFPCESRSTWDAGMLGGGVSSFYDFSISKNVLAMLIVSIFLMWIFIKAAKKYKENPHSAPSGTQGILETLFVFIRDEVAIPFIGKDKYMKYIPILMSVFFFILGLNLFGQVPFFGSTNVTGNLTVTMVLAILVALFVNFKGNKHYWQHVFWMPGVPVAVKPLLAVVEVMSLFIKPLTLMLRLAGNISAGHIAILSFIGLIFVFGNSGANLVGSSVGSLVSVPLTMFMMAIELIVAFVQAFVFTILTASYIGAATESHDDHH
ncbi:MAG TPA: F0F1 ATP synthase subunit A [Saprospiraceae bacterium]|nr:F0F1 ATP synthase subunit A [Saprospiraceae bacterium]MCB9328781.1 F0F1 ATP synthase subunit A [Lewinellaceae bacterium]HPK09612.1 F0F1 ATP synthase subunit A [Saprospiraceae bacterium]HRX29705.1 F0F1 ATP synthase subunit A [Saprospiraceae bacterium]